jgi:hypothetical protein
VEKICFDAAKHSDYHGHILIVYVFFDSGGKCFEQTRHFLSEFGPFTGQEDELGAPVFRIFTPDYQILFLKPVKYPGCIGCTFASRRADLTLGSALLSIQILEEMELFPGKIERFQEPVNVVANGLGDQIDAAAQRIVLAGGHEIPQYVNQATINQLTSNVNLGSCFTSSWFCDIDGKVQTH